jgi:hypothetical protein
MMEYTYRTNPGFTGMLLNGVEILNYKASESVYYGEIKEVEVTAPGSNYDIINPPVLSITDSWEWVQQDSVQLVDHFRKLELLTPGFDYLRHTNY